MLVACSPNFAARAWISFSSSFSSASASAPSSARCWWPAHQTLQHVLGSHSQVPFQVPLHLLLQALDVGGLLTKLCSTCLDLILKFLFKCLCICSFKRSMLVACSPNFAARAWISFSSSFSSASA